MSDQALRRYFVALVTARSHISQQQSRIQQLVEATSQAQNTLTSLSQAQERIQQTKSTVQQLIQVDEDEELDREQQQIDRSQAPRSNIYQGVEEDRNLPLIEVSGVEWAEKYLEAINTQNFKQVEAQQQVHGATMVTLDNTLARYQHKLAQLEERLSEFYRNRSSNRRSRKLMQ